ncbi:MAG: retroviral-like aspartic protease family protein [Ramlibacter sp.]
MTTSAFARGLCLSAALVCAAAHAGDEPPKCQYVQIAELPLRYTGPTLQVTTDGMIDGLAGPMLVDTGAAMSTLTRTATVRRNLSLGMTGEHASGIGGFSRLYSARVREFSVGPAKSARGSMWVMGDMCSAPSYDAIVGAPFLLQADMELSLAEKKMRFFRGANCTREHNLGYWGGDIFEIPFERHFDGSPNPHFTIEVNGEKMEAMIDSGAQTTAIMSSAARRAGLKLDAPGSAKLGYSEGIGTDRVARWSTIVERMQIGGEQVEHAEIAVLETSPVSGIEVLLGDDWLRAHRVLFAMSQRKLYVSYLGGEPFKPRTSLEPWLVQEAEAGNGDAQLIMSAFYASGRGVPRDAAIAASWLDKAAAGGNPRANLQLGRKLMMQGHMPEAVERLRAALDQLPAERTGALWLYLARIQTGQPDLGKQELQTAFERGESDDWPNPLAEFSLGHTDEARLLKAAADDAPYAKSRTCAADNYMWELYRARGDKEKADAAKARFISQCTRPKQTASAK